MDTLRDRLAELADDAPSGGTPAAELWARGKRAHRLRVGALAAALAVVGAVGTGIGVRLSDGDGGRSDIAPAETVTISLPIAYPVGEELSDLGDAPGALAAIWIVPRGAARAPEVVGLVAHTREFGTLPIEVSPDYLEPESYFALSPDGRRIAYQPSDPSAHDPMVHDLESGETYAPSFEDFRPGFEPSEGYTWIDDTHLVGQADIDGDGWVDEGEAWVWEAGTAATQLDVLDHVGSPYLLANAGWEPWFLTSDNPRKCLSLRDVPGGQRPVLCDVVGRLGPEVALTHDGDGAVIALDRRGVEDESLRHVVATPGAPPRAVFATELIAHALGLDGAPVDLGGGAS